MASWAALAIQSVQGSQTFCCVLATWDCHSKPVLLIFLWNTKGDTLNGHFTFTFTFMHLADAFIQSDLQLHSGYTFSLVHVFPWNRTHNLLRSWHNALPLSHTGTHFIRYTLLVPGWTPFCLNSLWHRFNKVLETFLRDFGPYWHDSITQLLQICRLHIHDANLPFHHIPKVLYWIEIWWLWRPFE